MIRYSNERKKRDREKKREEKGYVKYTCRNKTAYRRSITKNSKYY